MSARNNFLEFTILRKAWIYELKKLLRTRKPDVGCATRRLLIPNQITMTPLNALINLIGEKLYYTPFHVWADLYQPDIKNAIANPPYQ